MSERTDVTPCQILGLDRSEQSQDQRNRWSKGLVRHLRVSADCPLDTAYAIRTEREGGLGEGGSEDIYYTLIVGPKHLERVEQLRLQLEQSAYIGGPFSPERDV